MTKTYRNRPLAAFDGERLARGDLGLSGEVRKEYIRRADPRLGPDRLSIYRLRKLAEEVSGRSISYNTIHRWANQGHSLSTRNLDAVAAALGLAISTPK